MKSAPPSGTAPPSVALLACARGIGGTRGQSGQEHRRRARSGSGWRGKRTAMIKMVVGRLFPTSEKMRYFALRSNFITPLPLLLLHPARLTIASHTAVTSS
jgi:hypothetical protein